jgi:DNA-directed RNA polymerase subunit RPC12/RpoP
MGRQAERRFKLYTYLSCNSAGPYAILNALFDLKEEPVKETRRVVYMRGVFVCPKCRQSYVQEKWIEEFRIRCHKCDYRGTLTQVSVEEHMDEETVRR